MEIKAKLRKIRNNFIYKHERMILSSQRWWRLKSVFHYVQGTYYMVVELLKGGNNLRLSSVLSHWLAENVTLPISWEMNEAIFLGRGV